ncbi:uncharacterized protein [Triticum aestivum]|uniref:uncharacterized protein n=1 Tax=Triticum aestivum TaxID=4565 RepID=UPI001D013CA2|nr:uncharacterized protein LOC123075901 [Triticum aestivum]XP_044446310.1 uncharacterized protein LOC123175917 [Triticum aestivum]
MTKIFRSSFYRSKQPREEEEEEESAAGEYEYVDLEDGQGGKHAGDGAPGVDSDGPLASDVVLTTVIGIAFILVGCPLLLFHRSLQTVATGPERAGALCLALGAAAFVRLALLRGCACSSCWRTSD